MFRNDARVPSLTIKISGPTSMGVIGLKALSLYSALEATIILYGIPDAAVGCLHEDEFAVGTEEMREKIQSWITEVDSQVYQIRKQHKRKEQVDRFWKAVSDWDEAGEKYGGSLLSPGNPDYYRKAQQKVYSTMENLLTDTTQRERRPIIMLWLGWMALYTKGDTVPGHYYRQVLETYPDQAERCVVAEYGLGRSLKKQGKSKQADSIFANIPVKYAKLKEFKELFEECNRAHLFQDSIPEKAKNK